ncbi:MAG: hypothetical protein PHP73_06325 [Candidatus Omnitrophica bacterium]|nr:hypothetical protein [Candidatus Omnitrophota bacterium]
MTKRNKRFIFFFVTILVLFSTQSCFAGVLPSWNDSKAYKPRPVLFLHGFATGGSGSWDTARTSLAKYFSKYLNTYSYIETIDFQDPNGSVDTYDSGKLNPQGNSKGWSDKLQDKVNELLSTTKYGNYATKLNLVCHSMGGLAARWYLANYSSNFTEKIILIGVPNLGSPLAESANALSKIPKLGWLTLVPVSSVMSFVRDNVDLYTNAFSIDINGEAIDDLDNSPGGSGFIDKLNKVGQSSTINYYGIIGIDGNLANWFLFKDWKGGDSLVSKVSQLGTSYVSLKQSSQIYANHWREPKIASEETDNKILAFLDSTPPEFTLDNPQADSTTEINTNSISIKGKVYKEYLPADSVLNMTIIRQSDGYTMPVQTSLLEPSGLWIPNNPDSPVAEFDQAIAFPGEGTYKVSCQIKNPAGLASVIKVFWVKVTAQSSANIIVHCHNPEGKEIGSIKGLGQGSVGIYDGDVLIGSGAYDAATHGKPISIPSGNHTIKAKFNGMVLEQNIDVIGETTQELTFTFTRTSIDAGALISGSISDRKSKTENYTCGWWDDSGVGIWGTWRGSYYLGDSITFPGVFRGVSTMLHAAVYGGQFNTEERGEAPTFSASSSISENITISLSQVRLSIAYSFAHSTLNAHHLYAAVNSEGYILTLPKSSPYNPGSAWFFQQNMTSYPSESVVVSLDTARISGEGIGYNSHTLTSWTRLSIEGISFNSFGFFDQNTLNISGTFNETYSTLCDGLKISNVPYDPGDL